MPDEETPPCFLCRLAIKFLSVAFGNLHVEMSISKTPSPRAVSRLRTLVESVHGLGRSVSWWVGSIGGFVGWWVHGLVR